MVRLEEHKHYTLDKPIERLPLPKRVYLPISQHLGKACKPEVKVGDSVLVGQRIADTEAHVYAPIHASLSGKIAAIQEWPHPVLGRCQAVLIDSDGQDKKEVFKARQEEEAVRLSPDAIRKIVLESGIVGLGGASFPAHIKLNPPQPVDTLIINGAECEPYLTGDYRLMIEKTAGIFQGVKLVAQCLGVKKVFVAIEDNKPEAIAKFEELASKESAVIRVRVLKSAYPQGGEKQLIKNILGKEVPSGKLPFDIGVVVHNVATVFAIYEAVYFGKPLYERVVTVTASFLAHPKNLLVRLGTPIRELIDYCGPLQNEFTRIIIGGPMMGIAQYTQDVPVIKSSAGIVLLTEKETRAQEEEFCIRCGACVRVCPAGLMPCLINLASEKELWKEAKSCQAIDCIECGLCNYVCPANRRLTQSIKRAKLEVVK